MFCDTATYQLNTNIVNYLYACIFRDYQEFRPEGGCGFGEGHVFFLNPLIPARERGVKIFVTTGQKKKINDPFLGVADFFVGVGIKFSLGKISFLSLP